MSEHRPALFLDRDGVINTDKGYVYRREDFDWIDGAAETITAFNTRGWYVFIVTNQSGIARGYYTENDMHTLHDWMLGELKAKGAHVDHVYFAPYHEEGEILRYRRASIDRKPGPGMLLQAMADYPVRRELSLMIGDKETDMQAAKAAGVAGFLFSGGNLHTFAEWALASFEEGNRG